MRLWCAWYGGDMSSWQGRVYAIPDGDSERFFAGDDWQTLREACLVRDRFKCYRCGESFATRRNMVTAHHVVPRAAGGGNVVHNLVTLCWDCHDVVEAADCRSLVDIEATIDVKPRRRNKEDEFVSTDWHAWVYGGARPPQR